jgi:hypothetical protein
MQICATNASLLFFLESPQRSCFIKNLEPPCVGCHPDVQLEKKNLNVNSRNNEKSCAVDLYGSTEKGESLFRVLGREGAEKLIVYDLP